MRELDMITIDIEIHRAVSCVSKISGIDERDFYPLLLETK